MIMKCKICGAEILNGANFCIVCGNKVNYSQAQYINNESVVESISSEKKEQKYSGKEIVDIIANIITGGLAVIAFIMLTGCFLGFFDKSPIPFIVFIGIVWFANWLEEKIPKLPTIFIAIFEIVALVICFNFGNNVGAVISVKGGSPYPYPDITYEQAFEDYFENPTWKACGQDEDDNKIVKFTGTCSYFGTNAVTEIKFKIYEDQESFIVSSVKINGEDMGLYGDLFVIGIFEEYQNSH